MYRWKTQQSMPPIEFAHPQLSVRSPEEDKPWEFLPPQQWPPSNLILNDESESSIAYIFAFGAFTDKHSGVMYHDLIGMFPFMSLDGSVCFFVMYHYEMNSILALPIKGLDNKMIYEAYKKQYKELNRKGFKVK